MAHYIHGFIAKRRPLEAAAASLPGAVVCTLSGGFALLPLDHPSDADPAAGMPSCERLSAAMNAWAVEQSRTFPLAYVQTNYAGGPGEQSAVVWDGGQVLFGPLETADSDRETRTPLLEGAINRAVRLLGVARGSAIDEFDALGLGRHRMNEDWRDAADPAAA